MTKLVIDYQIHFNADQTEVYDYIADLTRHGEWSENLRVEAISDGPIA